MSKEDPSHGLPPNRQASDNIHAMFVNKQAGDQKQVEDQKKNEPKSPLRMPRTSRIYDNLDKLREVVPISVKPENSPKNS